MKSTTTEPSADGVHQEFYPNGGLRKEFTLKDGKRDGTEREWHINGQLQSEVHCLSGVINGRMQIWSDDGVLITQQFFFEGRPISKKKYDGLCASCPLLPVYSTERITNTLGRALARERKQRQNDPDLQLRIRQEVDADCADYLSNARIPRRRAPGLGDAVVNVAWEAWRRSRHGSSSERFTQRVPSKFGWQTWKPIPMATSSAAA